MYIKNNNLLEEYSLQTVKNILDSAARDDDYDIHTDYDDHSDHSDGLTRS